MKFRIPYCSQPQLYKSFGFCFTLMILLIFVYVQNSTNIHTLSTFDKSLGNLGTSERLRKLAESKLKLNCSKDAELFALDDLPGTDVAIPLPTRVHTSCPRALRPVTEAFPSTALVGFPESGNTWMRHLLQQLTGVYTGSFTVDESLLEREFPFEGVTKNVIAVETHDALESDEVGTFPLNEFHRVIVLLRNPLDSWLPLKRYYSTKPNDTSDIHVHIGLSIAFEARLRKWQDFLLQVFDFKGPVLPVFYEDLKQNLFFEMLRIAKFLSHPSLNEFSFCCVLRKANERSYVKESQQPIDGAIHAELGRIFSGVIQKAADGIESKSLEASQKLRRYLLRKDFQNRYHMPMVEWE